MCDEEAKRLIIWWKDVLVFWQYKLDMYTIWVYDITASHAPININGNLHPLLPSSCTSVYLPFSLNPFFFVLILFVSFFFSYSDLCQYVAWNGEDVGPEGVGKVWGRVWGGCGEDVGSVWVVPGNPFPWLCNWISWNEQVILHPHILIDQCTCFYLWDVGIKSMSKTFHFSISLSHIDMKELPWTLSAEVFRLPRR